VEQILVSLKVIRCIKQKYFSDRKSIFVSVPAREKGSKHFLNNPPSFLPRAPLKEERESMKTVGFHPP
jgi:hypothetical protein